MLEFPLPAFCLFFLHFLHFLPPCNIFLHLWLFCAIGRIHQQAHAVKFNYSCTSWFTDYSCLLLFSSSIVSCTSGLLRLQLYSTNYQVQLLAVLMNFSGLNCLLPILKLNCNCTSGLLRLQSFSTVLNFFKFNGFLSVFYLIINI
jgi:hypothetical protein